MKNILVVDNHPVVLKFMSQLLEKNGHRVWTATDGLAALDMLRTLTPDTIFIDLVMPNISGDKLCRIIRRMPKFKDVFIVILSAIAAEEKSSFTDFGADILIAKGPFDQMAEHILSVVDGHTEDGDDALKGRILGDGSIYKRAITRELLESKKHFEAVLHHMSEGIIELSTELKIVYANPSAVDIIGMPEEKLLSGDFRTLFHATHHDQVCHLLASTDRSDGNVPVDLSVTLNGKQVILNLIRVKADKRKPLLVILRDVSHQKQMEEQLHQAQKMEAIATLAGGIAHQFNNALTAIMGNIELIEMAFSDNIPFRGRIRSIRTSAKRMATLTRQLLAYSQGGRYATRNISINELLGSVLPLAKSGMPPAIRMATNLSKDLPMVNVDEMEMQMVFSSIISNAVEAISVSGTITISTGKTIVDGRQDDPSSAVRPGRYVSISIVDDGKGMDGKTLSRIFEPFFTTYFPGRGLGMAAVYGIVKNHGGWVDVDSEPGNGTAVNIYLPVVEDESLGVNLAGTKHGSGGKMGTILVIDDEDLVMDVYLAMLQHLGYRTLPAKTGTEAISIAKKFDGDIDLAFLDLGLPDMDGDILYPLIKEARPGMKVIICSGKTIDGPAQKLLDHGAHAFIEKPFSLSTLSSELKKITGPAMSN